VLKVDAITLTVNNSTTKIIKHYSFQVYMSGTPQFKLPLKKGLIV